MATKNLWGDIKAEATIRTPANVLKEQATALSEMTKGVLAGTVRSGTEYNKFKVGLSIVAPALNNYEFDVVEVEHGIELYPLKVTPAWEKYGFTSSQECENEEEFVAALGGILGSDRVKRAINSLIAQSKET
jgi:hypothetical protein